MKKIWITLFAAAFAAGSLSACGSSAQNTALSTSGESTPAESTAKSNSAGDTLSIVATVFPEYDWVSNILGENSANAELTLLLDSGVDLHSYQPTAEDILTISNCDLFLYVGGESDEWVEDVLKESSNPDRIVINLMDELGDAAKEEEIVEGMQEEEHEHESESSDAHDETADESDEHDETADESDAHDETADESDAHDEDSGEVEYDEHVWLSLRNASTLCDRISSALSKLDPSNAATYQSNTKTYQKQLAELDSAYEETVSTAPVHTLLFGDRFPFRYLTDDYGLEYYAAFAGCSAETEASFETISYLAKKMDELSLHSIMTIDGSDQKIAETIIQNTVSKDQQILQLDSMQSTTAKDITEGASYVEKMQKNLNTLKEALK